MEACRKWNSAFEECGHTFCSQSRDSGNLPGALISPPWAISHLTLSETRLLTSCLCSQPHSVTGRITSVPWERPGLAPGLLFQPLGPMPTPGQDRSLYSTKEMITSHRTVASASQGNLAPPLNMAATASSQERHGSWSL